MNAIRGIIRDGKVVFDTPPDFPEGTPVAVSPRTPDAAIADEASNTSTTRAPLEPCMLLAEGDFPDDLPDDNDTSPEAIARRLALMDRVQPWMTPEEFAEWERVRAQDKAFQLSQWEKWSKEIGGLFE